jgi:hypothetical protein
MHLFAQSLPALSFLEQRLLFALDHFTGDAQLFFKHALHTTRAKNPSRPRMQRTSS